MNALELLTRCRDAESDMRRIEARIAQRRDALERITACYAPREGGSGSVSSDKMADMIAAIDELERCLQKRKQAYAAECTAACDLIGRLNEREAQVIDGAYMRREPISVIARRCGYTEGYMRRVKSQAEQYLGQISDAEVQGMMPEWYWEAVAQVRV